MKLTRLSIIVAALVGAAQIAGAQTDTGRAAPPPVVGRGRAGRQGQAFRPLAGRQGAGRQGQPAVDPAERQLAIRQIRQAMMRRIRTQLSLSAEQMRMLQLTQQKYERQNNEVLRSERQARQGLRAAMLDTGATRDQAKIAQYIDQLTQAKHKQVDMLDAEQKELSSFLTPMQRAQYLGLKERLDKMIVDVRQQGLAAGRGAAAGAPPTKPDTLPPRR